MLLIIDTSVLISVLISRGQSYAREILEAAYDQKLTLALCEETFQELRRKIRSDSIKRLGNYRPAKIASFIAWYKYNAQLFSIKKEPKVTVVRDKKDSIYLQLAQVTSADYLISFDEDLLVLKKFKKTKIITPEEFIKR